MEDHGEELLPPLQVVTRADSYVVPRPVGDVVYALELQQAVKRRPDRA